MSSYTIFLTKSCQAAHVIAYGLEWDMNEGKNGIKAVQSGSVEDSGLIPAIYHNKGYFYAAAECENWDGSEAPKYELIIC